MTCAEHILVSKPVAAEALSISVVTLNRLTRAGKIRPTRVGRRVLFSTAELHRFAKRCERVTR